MNDKKYIFIIGALTLIILFGGVVIVSNSSSTPQISSSQNARLQLPSQSDGGQAKAETVEPTSYDWGNISYSGTKATKTFTIKNTGSDPLKLFNIKTSCHCTKAHVTIDGKDSPDFGMSGISSWMGEVPVGKEAKVTAIFDQTFHGPQGIGPITRFVSVETNDRGTPKITFTLTGTVVK
ncbi:MAG: DUF1573 domain-containing protein [Candidatus Levybacteria bacterium]|nr:DUF1573 domain-containing protein [Candidatus Levybacteria bacterium]